MTPKILLRLAAGCLLFFAIGHSVGHVTRHHVADPKAQAVLRQMADNRFDMFGQLRSYDENYTGMSANLILTLIAFATVLWIFSNWGRTQPTVVRTLLLPIMLCTLGFSITSYVYFFPVPAISCLLAALFMGLGYRQLKQKRNPIPHL